MREFFYGWRRKVGCVALVMACMLMIAWVRSVIVRDTMMFGFDGSSHYITCTAGRIEWTRWWYPGVRQPTSGVTWYSGPEFTPPLYLTAGGESPVRVDWTVPHWSLVLAVSLLAAHLILWKPRPKERHDA